MYEKERIEKIMYEKYNTNEPQHNTKKVVFSPLIDSYGFYPMPNNVIRFFKSLNLTESEFIYINGLYSVKGKNGAIYPKQKTIGEYLGLQKRRLIDIGKSLEEEKHYITRTRPNSHRSYRYNLTPFENLVKAIVERHPDRAHNGHFNIPSVVVKHFNHFKDKYGLNARDFLLMCFCFMLRHANFESEYEEIRGFLGWSDRTVRRSVKRLESIGFLTLKQKETAAVNKSTFDLSGIIAFLESEIKDIQTRSENAPKNQTRSKSAPNTRSKSAPGTNETRSKSAPNTRSKSAPHNNESIYNKKDIFNYKSMEEKNNTRPESEIVSKKNIRIDNQENEKTFLSLFEMKGLEYLKHIYQLNRFNQIQTFEHLLNIGTIKLNPDDEKTVNQWKNGQVVNL